MIWNRACTVLISVKDVNRDEQNRRFCWPTSQLILMLGILIGGRFWDFTCLIWNFLIWKQQNLHIKENDQHLVQLLPNKLVTPFTTVLLVSITRSLPWTMQTSLKDLSYYTSNSYVVYVPMCSLFSSFPPWQTNNIKKFLVESFKTVVLGGCRRALLRNKNC